MHDRIDAILATAPVSRNDGKQIGHIAAYLLSVVREMPGDDIEFGFPRSESDTGARPENRALYDWWRSEEGSFALHVSMHGMGFAAGPWFLIDESWKDRCHRLKERCIAKATKLGYVLHDVDRQGEKGFVRLGRGFCTRPDSRYMRKHFLDLGDGETAGLFRPSSMETIRFWGNDPLTLVTEMPLFITPGVGSSWDHRIQLPPNGSAASIAGESSFRTRPAPPMSPPRRRPAGFARCRCVIRWCCSGR